MSENIKITFPKLPEAADGWRLSVPSVVIRLDMERLWKEKRKAIRQLRARTRGNKKSLRRGATRPDLNGGKQ